ncbi:O-glucosyltransferase rumi homolog [Episyrphus balteatus]|uniref:O-glucosyltransferase rumi homolog n=1 Tax=Episyrphus balteatus TaxID=286459 RepID=UPI002485403F|nr:O-glucosyltransferase rumi homolog [Episyrphus balteatus]
MKILIYLLLLIHIVLAIESEGTCSIKKEQCSARASKYERKENTLLYQIQSSIKAYSPCPKDPDDSCSCHTNVIEKDLAPFQSTGITKKAIETMGTYGTKYQIVDHTLYRQKTCMFPSRCSGIEHFIKPLLKELPNMEMIVNCRDWPQIRRDHGPKGPVLSFSKTNEYLDIMYPAWAFWEGGPAIALHPTGIGRWDKHRNSISMAGKKWPWEEKLGKGFFRGSRTSDERDSLVLLSRKNPDLVDAQYTKNQAWKSLKDTLDAEPASEVTFEDHCKYKYLFNFRGVAASFRLKHLFLCKSLVFHVGSEWNEFFYFAMKPWVHYIPIKSYPTEQELESILIFFKEHDDLAKEIAQRGYKFIWNHLRLTDVQCYWKMLLTEYGKLMRYEVEVDKNLKKII